MSLDSLVTGSDLPALSHDWAPLDEGRGAVDLPVATPDEVIDRDESTSHNRPS